MAINQIPRALLKRVELKGEYRSSEQVKEHYEIEKALATRLRESSREERRTLYASLYDELFQRVPTAGDCAASLAATRFVKKVYALEVSEEITKSLTGPKNFELMLFDGCSIPLPAESVSIAYSHQVMEHLHPDDALEQLTNIYKTLTKQGIYICVTPNRLSGPHDISNRFDVVATGFHLKEYTNTELSNLFNQAGFSKVRVYAGALGMYMRCPLFLLRLLEGLLDRLPHRPGRVIARLSLLFNIRLVGVKK